MPSSMQDYFNLGQAIRKRQDENKAIAARTKAIETLAPEVAEAAGISREMVEQYLQPDPNESPRQRYERLNEVYNQLNFANTLREQRQKQQAQQLKLDEYARNQAQTQRINQYADMQNMLAGVAGGPFRGGLSPDVAAAAEQYSRSPLGQARSMGADITPEMLTAYASGNGEQFTPEIIDLGNGQSAMTTSKKSAVPVRRGTNTAEKPNVVTVNGQQYYQPEPGAPFKPVPSAAAKPVDPLRLQMNMGLYTQKMQDIAAKEKSGAGMFTSQATHDAELLKMRREANILADSMGYQMPYPDAQPAAKGSAAPATAAAPSGTPETAPGQTPARLYRIQGNQINIDPKSDPVAALQQAIDDGNLSQEQALQYLKALGYTLKK